MASAHRSGKDILAVIQAYFDESGIHGGDDSGENKAAPVCVVAGYFGGSGSLKKLGKDWKIICRRYRVPEFHSKDFWALDKKGKRVGVYKGWSDTKAEVFLDELLRVIERHRKVHPVASAVVVDDFNRLPYNKRRFLTGGELRNGKFSTSGCPSKPYFLPFQVALIDAADHAPIGGKANFFFDLNKNFKGYALDLFAVLKRQAIKVADRMGEIGFPTGLEAPQLQAADLLCYQSYQYALLRMKNPDEKHNPIVKRLLTNRVARADTFFNTEFMEILCGDVKIPPEKKNGENE